MRLYRWRNFSESKTMVKLTHESRTIHTVVHLFHFSFSESKTMQILITIHTVVHLFHSSFSESKTIQKLTHESINNYSYCSASLLLLISESKTMQKLKYCTNQLITIHTVVHPFTPRKPLAYYVLLYLSFLYVTQGT